MNYLLINWGKLHQIIFNLAQQIEKDNLRFDLIVSIARGGYYISHNEIRETIESLTRLFKKQKLTDVQSIKRLTKIGIPKK